LLTALRAGTVAAHRRIEALAPMTNLLAPSLTAGAYIASLRAMHAFHTVTLGQLAPFVAADPTLRGPDLGRLAALAEDLAWFGVTPRTPNPAKLRLGGRAAALGTLYVVEGSALGARVIGRAVALSLSVRPGRGGSFYCGLAADAARQRWQDFCSMLAREGATMPPSGFAEAVASANATFASLERRLQTRAPASARRQPPASHLETHTPMTERACASARSMI
jgi:heme oxygenase